MNIHGIMTAIHASTLWTVVPVRGMASGKSRLAPVLDPGARKQLNRLLLTLTLDAIGRWRGDLSRCVVVSPCEEALEMSARRGAIMVREPPEAGGLNGAAALGALHAGRNGAVSVMVLPCDLPGLTADSLAAMERAAATARHMVIAPDQRGTGTNALLVSHDCEFRFGERSYARHLLLAAERGWTAVVMSRPELKFDLDTPADLAAWSGGGRAGARRQCSNDIVLNKEGVPRTTEEEA